MEPVFLKNPIQYYAWGDRGKKAFIPNLLGIPGEVNMPYAELWIGAHPIAPSRVVWGEKNIPLNEWIAANPGAILGKRVARRFGNQLPFLLKVLSAAEALSIQVHPNKEQAEKLHVRDPEHYPDANHKPEMAIALDGLRALAGFKSFADTVETLKAFPEIAAFVGELAAAVVSGRSQPEAGGRGKWVRDVYLTALQQSEEHPEKLREVLQRLDKRLRESDFAEDFLSRLYTDLRQTYGDDVGLLSLFLLQFVELQPGEAIFIGAGIPHAYLKGNIIECMANSDNVVRAGLTPKFKDMSAMAEIVTRQPAPLPVYRPNMDADEAVYPVPIEEFRIRRYKWAAGTRREIATEDSVKILLVLEGEFLLSWGGKGSLRVRKGESVVVPAVVGKFEVEAKSPILAFLVDVPGNSV